ncbi:MAG: methionyl-tRNA formyltransferase [Muribaculaceae bacterium]|nr:methionyl-tRNA formyltransferase [Muribaculaceae bacterium]
MEKKDLRIVFFGTPEFAVESLDALVSHGFNVVATVTMPDKVAGRGHKVIQSDVKRYSDEHGLLCLQPPKLKNPEWLEQLRSLRADLFIVIAFRMLPEAVWAMPPLGTFNLHASLLPKYRGAAPINHAVMNGDTVTGVTTFFLQHEIDTGDIIEQRECAILPEDNVGDVHDRLMHLGARMVLSTVEHILDGTVETRPQPVGEFTPAPKIFKETCRIDWILPARCIHDFVRGLSPYPAAWTVMTDGRDKPSDLKIFTTRLTGRKVNAGTLPGTVSKEEKTLLVAAGDEWLEILELQPAGKRRMEAAAFLLGYDPVKMD